MRRGALATVVTLMVSGAVAQAAGRTDGSQPATAKVTKLVTHVPARTLNKVGAGKLLGPSRFEVTKLSGAPLTAAGKPELLAFELAWCPHCAADSWGLAIALSRFGKFSGLREIDSGTLFGTKFHANPAFPHTRGLSFFGAGYRSRYLRFANVVLQDVRGTKRQTPTGKEQRAISALDSQGIVPVVDVGGSWGLLNAAFSPGILAHKSWSQIAAQLADAGSPIAQRIDGLANLLTAAICATTNNRPASVCSSSGVQAALAARLH